MEFFFFRHMSQLRIIPDNAILKSRNYAYHINRCLSQSPSGVVYDATGQNIPPEEGVGLCAPLHVVVKQKAGKPQRFYDEVKRSPYLGHYKGITPATLEQFETEDGFFSVFLFFEGETLCNMAGRLGGLQERDALLIMEQLAEGVCFLHNQGLLHLDLKTLNVLINNYGQLQIIDTDTLCDVHRIKEFAAAGMPFTIGYASPEVINASKGIHIGPAADIYSLGAILFNLLTNQAPPSLPFLLSEGFPAEVLERRGVSEETIELIRSCFSIPERKRPQTVQRFLLSVRHILNPDIPMAEKTARDKGEFEEEEKTAKPMAEEKPVDTFEDSSATIFSPVWPDNIAPKVREAVMEILSHVHQVGEKTVSHATEYGLEEKSFPIWGYHALVSCNLYADIMETERDTAKNHLPIKLSVNDILLFFIRLQQLTGLSFRLSSPYENCNVVSAPQIYWEQNPVLMYDEQCGFGYFDVIAISEALKTKHELTKEERMHFFKSINCTPYNGPETFAFEIVCERTEAEFHGNFFNRPWTQEPMEAISPLGFGYYKTLKEGLWRVTTPELSPSNLLQTAYAEISPIGLYRLPTKEKTRPKFVGLKAKTENRVALYVLFNRHFNRILDVPKEEWDELAE